MKKTHRQLRIEDKVVYNGETFVVKAINGSMLTVRSIRKACAQIVLVINEDMVTKKYNQRIKVLRTNKQGIKL